MDESSEIRSGVVPVEAMRPVKAGWTTEDLRLQLGPPLHIQSPNSMQTPTDVFRSLGSILEFEIDQDLDEVWVYKHDRRGKFVIVKLHLSFIGVRDGKVTGIWQHHYDRPA